jgi:uncharacterized protein
LIAAHSNVLVYAHRRGAQLHANASARLRELAEGSVAWAIPWPCLHEFYATVTHPKIYAPPSTSAEAIDQIEAWMQSPTLSLLCESSRHWAQLKPLLQSAKVVGGMTHDARIAALCLQHGVKLLWTADRDFARFKSLATANPLVAD